MEKFLLFAVILIGTYTTIDSAPVVKTNATIFGKKNDQYSPHTEEEHQKELEAEENTEDKASYVVEGDIKINKNIKQIRKNGTLVRDVLIEQYRWPSTTIPYVFEASATQLVRNVATAAMNDFRSFTCIDFAQRTSEADYLNIQADAMGCWSYVGKNGGKQDINIGAGCEYKGTVIHEIMHALGFFHEHTRLDRDKYVKIEFANILAGKANNFEKYRAGQADYHGEDYDFDSVMHYRAKAFSHNDKNTIVPVDSNIDPNRMGQRDGFSNTDIKQINKAYKCKTPSPATTPASTTQTNGNNQGVTTKARTTQQATTKPTTRVPTSSIVPPLVATTKPLTVSPVNTPPLVTTVGSITTTGLPNSKTAPIPPAVVPPTPSPSRGDGSTGEAIFPKLMPLNTRFRHGCQQYNPYPCWPYSFSVNQCNCHTSSQPQCRCNCIKVKKDNIESAYLCYKKALRAPNFKFSTIGELPGMKCFQVIPTSQRSNPEKRYLCHSIDAPYNFVWHSKPSEIQREIDHSCMKFDGFKNDASYICNRMKPVQSVRD